MLKTGTIDPYILLKERIKCGKCKGFHQSNSMHSFIYRRKPLFHHLLPSSISVIFQSFIFVFYDVCCIDAGIRVLLCELYNFFT